MLALILSARAWMCLVLSLGGRSRLPDLFLVLIKKRHNVQHKTSIFVVQAQDSKALRDGANSPSNERFGSNNCELTVRILRVKGRASRVAGHSCTNPEATHAKLGQIHRGSLPGILPPLHLCRWLPMKQFSIYTTYALIFF